MAFSAGRSSAVRGTPIGARGSGLQSDRFKIQDEDLDELDDSIPCSSPFFTQPTQIVNRETQPTQIVERRTTLHHSSPPIPDAPSSEVEVPASSPFQSHSITYKPAIKKPVGRLASLMAPAGTAFRAPPNALPQRPAIKQQFLQSSEDDLNDYKHRDSSDDEAPMRGDIRPSSFLRKEPTRSSVPSFNSQEKSDVSLESITDLRLRYLTKEVHKIVAKCKPEILFKECRDAVQGNGFSTEGAVTSLLDKYNKSKALSSFRTGGTHSGSASDTSSFSGKSTNRKQTKLSSQLNSNTAKSSPSPPPSPAMSKPPLPRRRLMAGRRNRSPSPDNVFSVSSSQTSTPQSSAESLPQSSAKTASPQDVAKPRRRLVRGTRNPSPSDVITIDSDSETGPQALSSRKRKAEAEPAEDVKNEIIDILSDSDNGEDFANITDSGSGDDSQKSRSNLLGEEDSVLEYLNSCSTEELGRMTGLPKADAELVIDHRPFDDIEAVQKVSRKQKKKGSTKSARTDIGTTLVDKLTQWFAAFKAAAVVIKKCEERGAELESIMSTWEMDKNGITKDSGATTRLPLTKRPTLMDKSVQLKSYQQFGLNWLNLIHERMYSGILADDMGLGKTCQVISFISHLVEAGKKRGKEYWPNLIVVPPSTLENWENEFQRFAPAIKIFRYAGTNRKEFDPSYAEKFHVVLTSYSQIERNKDDLEWLQQLNPYAAIFDEGHKLKNRTTLVYRNLMRIPSEWRLVLSGTPVQNNLKELLSLLSFVEPSLFGARDLERLQIIFEAKVPSRDIHNFAALAKERVGNARTMMAPFILQRRKDDVLDLPQKTETTIIVGAHPDQRAIYEELKGSYLGSKGKASKAIKVANPWMQLKKASIHHQLFRRYFTDDKVAKITDILWKKCSREELAVQSKEPRHKELFKSTLLTQSDFELHLLCKDFDRYVGHFDIPDRSWESAPKVQKVLELVRDYMANGDRCLIFSRFELVINILRETFYHAEIAYCELTGSVGVADRFPMIEKFNKNTDIPVFLLTTGAGGTGLNLTAANKIIIFDQSDNPQDDVQASNRVHRIGQKREVEVIKLITENTVEGLIYNSCVKKLMLAAVVGGQFYDDEESVEDECRKKMLLGTEAEFRASQA